MTDLQLVGIELTKHQVACGTTYTGLLETLAPQLAAAELLDWAQICRAIAAAGWHGWESTNRYLALSPALLAAGGPRLLLATGHYGLGLSGSSIEPGISYFAGVETLLAARQLPAMRLDMRARHEFLIVFTGLGSQSGVSECRPGVVVPRGHDRLVSQQVKITSQQADRVDPGIRA